MHSYHTNLMIIIQITTGGRDDCTDCGIYLLEVTWRCPEGEARAAASSYQEQIYSTYLHDLTGCYLFCHTSLFVFNFMFLVSAHERFHSFIH